MRDSRSVDGTLNHLFPSVIGKRQYPVDRLTLGARIFARAVLSSVPQGEDQRAALRKVREALMTAVAGCNLDGISDVDEWEMEHGIPGEPLDPPNRQVPLPPDMLFASSETEKGGK